MIETPLLITSNGVLFFALSLSLYQALHNTKAPDMPMSDIHHRFDHVTRVEVIDNYGRTYTSHNADKVWVALQDDGRTLKIFHTGDTKHSTNTQHRDALARDLAELQEHVAQGVFDFDDTDTSNTP